jgi:hypothetical protein
MPIAPKKIKAIPRIKGIKKSLPKIEAIYML